MTKITKGQKIAYLASKLATSVIVEGPLYRDLRQFSLVCWSKVSKKQKTKKKTLVILPEPESIHLNIQFTNCCIHENFRKENGQ